MSLLKNKQRNSEEIGECSSGIYKILCNGTTNGAICLSDFWISLPKFKPSYNWVWHLQDKALLHVLLAVLKSNDISGPWASSWRLGQSFPQSSQWWGDVRERSGQAQDINGDSKTGASTRILGFMIMEEPLRQAGARRASRFCLMLTFLHHCFCFGSVLL